MAELTPDEHRMYHEEVSLTGCGVAGCDWVKAVAIHEGMAPTDSAPTCDAGYAHSDPVWPESAAHVHDDDGCAGCAACAEPERYDDHTCIGATS